MQRLVSKTSKNVLSKWNRRFCSVSRTSPLRTVSIPSARLCTCRACTAAVSGNPSALFRRFAGSATLPEEKPETKPKDARDNEVLPSIPGAKTTNDVMIIVFTCRVCNTRAARKISKEAYNHGVVLIRCPGCNNLHLIADHLGYFDDNSTNIEQILAQKGEKVTRMDDKQVLEFLHKEDLK